MPAVHTIIFDKSGERVLLIRRRDIPVWALPGGGIDRGESPEEAACREALEETGLRVKIKKFVGTYLPQNFLTKKTFIYVAEPISGTLQLSDETGAVAFFHTKFLPKKMPPPYAEWIADAKSNFLDPINKKITTVSYWVALKNLIKHPIFVIKFLFFRTKK